MNRIIKIISLLLVTLFFSLYFSKYNNDYYENERVLTEEAMKKFEKDVRAGKKIIASNYLPQEKNYNNKISNIGIKASDFIEKSFDKGLQFIMNYLSSAQKD